MDRRLYTHSSTCCTSDHARSAPMESVLLVNFFYKAWDIVDQPISMSICPFLYPPRLKKNVNNLTQCVSQPKHRVTIGNFISKLATIQGTVFGHIAIIRHINDFQTSYTSTYLKCQQLLSKMGNFLIMLSRQLSTNSCNICSTNGWVHMPGVAHGAVVTTS